MTSLQVVIEALVGVGALAGAVSGCRFIMHRGCSGELARSRLLSHRRRIVDEVSHAPRDEIIGASASINAEGILKHGPGLRFGRSIWVKARDPRGYVLLGGLGGLGVGTMWEHDDGRLVDDPTYATAPEQTRTCGALPPADADVPWPSSCSEPFGHDGPHRVPPRSYSGAEWSGGAPSPFG